MNKLSKFLYASGALALITNSFSGDMTPHGVETTPKASNPDKPDGHASPTTPIAPRFTGHFMVPGGIHSIAVLLSHKALYPGFDFAHARLDVMDRSVIAYVSYRMNGKIYYTKKVRYFPKGEPIVTDGHMILLQRCGNIVKYLKTEADASLENEPDDIYPPETLNVPTLVANTPVTVIMPYPLPAPKATRKADVTADTYYPPILGGWYSGTKR